MSDFASPDSVQTTIEAHLIGVTGRAPFVEVFLVPGKEEPIYIITTEALLVSLAQGFLEDRLGRSCAYVQGSFLVYGKEVHRLLD